MKLRLLHLWFYWPLIKQLPVEAHNEAGDLCRWESSSPSRLYGFIGSAPLPQHHSIKASPTFSGNWLGKGKREMKSVPGRLKAGVRGHWGRDYVLGSRRF